MAEFFRFRDLPHELQIRTLRLVADPVHQHELCCRNYHAWNIILLLNKDVYNHLAPTVYRQALFRFDRADHITNHFMSVASSTCLRNVRRMQCYMLGLSPGYKTDSEHLQLFEGYVSTLQAVMTSEKLPALESLTLLKEPDGYVRVHEGNKGNCMKRIDEDCGGLLTHLMERLEHLVKGIRITTTATIRPRSTHGIILEHLENIMLVLTRP